MAKRSVQFNIRISDLENDLYTAAAEACGLTVSDWARSVLGAATGDSDLVQSLRKAQAEQRRMEA